MLGNPTVFAQNNFDDAETAIRIAEFSARKDVEKYREQLARSMKSLVVGCGHLSDALSDTLTLLEKVNKRLDVLERERRRF